jgi:hypothetical protein
MTKRQRVIAEEEAPISAPIESEEVKRARERIKELERWIEARRK